jgi:hypothetical protein
MTIDSSGNVGVGTTSPSDRLEVSGNTFNRATFTATANVQTGIRVRRTGGVNNIDWELYSPASSTDLRLYDSSGTAGDRVTFAAGGNVGIGTTNPSSSLQVNKSSQTLGASIPSGATIISNLAGGNGVLELGVDSTYLSYIQSRNITNQTWYQLLLNPSGGNVGIGTTTPSAKLDVSGSIIATGSAAIRDSILVSATSDTTNYYFKANANYNYGKAFSLEVRGGSPSYGDIIAWGEVAGLTLNSLTGSPLTLKTSNIAALTADNSQNILIGKTSGANAKLDVNGNTIISGSLNVTQAITASNLVITNLIVQTITASNEYVTGSSQFGSLLTNKHQFTGSVEITGSATITGTLSVTDTTDSTNPFGLKTFTKSLTVTTSWLDTGISGTDLATGTYIIQVLVDNSDVSGGQVTEYYSGTMSWFSGTTNSTEYDEIVLHKAGNTPGGNWINLRTLRQTSPNTLKLQIISNVTTSGADNYIFKFRRMI